jgi:hypothetical protein
VRLEDLTKSQIRALKLLSRQPRVVAQRPDGARIPSSTAKSLSDKDLAEFVGVRANGVDAGRRVIKITDKGYNLVRGYEV